jgi:hypothetical protein
MKKIVNLLLALGIVLSVSKSFANGDDLVGQEAGAANADVCAAVTSSQHESQEAVANQEVVSTKGQ